VSELNEINKEAWNQETYNAWIERFGTPKEYIEKLTKDPSSKLYPIYEFFGDVKGKSIMNLMGSNGTKAAALGILGAEVTIVDFSEGNKRYAEELAKEAGVNIEYIVSDVLELPIKKYEGKYDVVFAELGIIHYFTDLKPFINIIKDLLKQNGKMILRDFHPVSTKLITSRGSTAKVRKHKVSGDYFDETIEEREVAYSKYLNDDNQEHKKVKLRKWTLGEVVTAVAEAGLYLEVLREEPNLSSETFDNGIPKTFTLTARKQNCVKR
jgi:2-polyprenyl-3-methyl-5-hydroxy-6-metoxy-1,4-benzoquinol methylase